MTEQPKPFEIQASRDDQGVVRNWHVYRSGELFAIVGTERDARIIAALPLLVDLARRASSMKSTPLAELEELADEAMVEAGLQDDEEGV